MQKFEIFDEHYWKPLENFGLTHSFWNINIKTVILTWVVLGFILILSLLARLAIEDKESISGFLVLSYVRSFNNLITNSLGKFSFTHFSFITSLFTFIFICNIISLIPWLDEPTTDVSTTLALGISAFLYVQISAIIAKGFKEYIKEYFSPFFLLFPLNVIGELAKIISISFRLFGNIFGGSIISRLWMSSISGSLITEILGIITGINLLIVLFFIMFEGFIQAFVFSMLTLTYLSVAISQDHEENNK
jgi:F-type H+-transporting ATPase subunit a